MPQTQKREHKKHIEDEIKKISKKYVEKIDGSVTVTAIGMADRLNYNVNPVTLRRNGMFTHFPKKYSSIEYISYKGLVFNPEKFLEEIDELPENYEKDDDGVESENE